MIAGKIDLLNGLKNQENLRRKWTALFGFIELLQKILFAFVF